MGRRRGGAWAILSEVHIAYIDESGSRGFRGSISYTLGCVLVSVERWPDIFEDLLGYRRFLKDAFKVPVRAEIKANHLLRNAGAFRDLKLSEAARLAIYRGMMRLQPKAGTLAFGVIIRKAEMVARGRTEDPRDVAWDYLLQRLERFTTKTPSRVLVVHDEGDGDLIRKLVRKARRAGTAGSAFGTGSLNRPAKLIVDDPVPRRSHDSYFVQLADLTAYAAFRRVYPPPAVAGRVEIVPNDMWDELGDARLAAVSALRGGFAPGIVVWP